MNKLNKVAKDWERRIERSSSEATIAILDETIEEWEKVIKVFENSSDRERDQFDKVENRIKINRRKKLVDRLKELREIAVEKDDKSDSTNNKPHNYKGELTDQCIQELEELVKEKSGIGTEEFFKTAQARFPSCRKSNTGESISWSTLRSRIKSTHPDIYKKTKSR